MREALRGLTGRGKALLAVAGVIFLAAFVFGEADLLRVAGLLALTPFASALVLGRTRYQISSARRLHPARVEVGQQAQVTLRLRNRSRVPTGTMMLEDRLPYALGTRPRLVLERLPGGAVSSVTYSLSSDQRGRFDVGPLIVRLTDPFGLMELVRSYPTTDRLTVVPATVPLTPARLAGEYSNAGESLAHTVAVHGEDDTATREYRHGDDLRRVHWPSTAKTGELMVRREEQPWESKATVLLDERAAGHRGDGPHSSFEWAVSATASISVTLVKAGYRLRMASQTAELEPDLSGPGIVLDHLAGARPQRHATATALADRSGGADRAGLLIAVLGTMTVGEAEHLGRLCRNGSTCVALLLDATTWQRLGPTQRAAADQAAGAAAAVLMRSGWRVIPVRQGDALQHLWHTVARGAQGFATRAPMAETVSGGGPR